MIKVYTLPEVLKMFPKDWCSETQFKRLVEEHGCYVSGGKTPLMTEADIDRLINRLSSPAARPTPADTEAGLLVVIGHPIDGNGVVLLQWCPFGAELRLLDEVSVHSTETLSVLATVSCTHGDVVALRTKFSDSRFYGYWYARTQALADEVRAMMDREEKDSGIR